MEFVKHMDPSENHAVNLAKDQLVDDPVQAPNGLVVSGVHPPARDVSPVSLWRLRGNAPLGQPRRGW
ncbi:hypothetical protein [Kutzneria sp. 744]|uniref:hypothetical protein n=1 Tax=Kutzneria sp. (strain 744) TaxID=345341 RepID=UPI001E3E3CCC|nr:hypothetical protein [Kutzneria sp. 744]